MGTQVDKTKIQHLNLNVEKPYSAQGFVGHFFASINKNRFSDNVCGKLCACTS